MKPHGVWCVVVAVLCGACAGTTLPTAPTSVVAGDRGDASGLTLVPNGGSVPLMIHITLDVPTSAANNRQFYCPTLTWTWGDGTGERIDQDCVPYVADASIPQHYAADHVFRTPGTYQVSAALTNAGATIYSDTRTIVAR